MSGIRSRKSIKEAQQELAQNCGFGNEVIWDLLPSSDSYLLMKKIEQLIPNQSEGQDTIVKIRRDIFDSVWKQRKYTNKLSVSYIFYVMVTKDENFRTALYSTEYSCHPVFRCKKCDKGSDTSSCCMIYVDETGRVYQNWQSYINENVLPPGTMIAPRKGIYNFDISGKAILEIYCTPNGKPKAKLKEVAESGSAIMGVGAACVPVAALIFPVAAPLMATASVVGLGVGAFTAVTSALNLRDRKKHGQSVSLGNREARASYLGVLGGSVGVAAAGTTRVMTSMASAGKATKSIEVLVNGLNISSVAISGSGVVHGVLDLIFKVNDGDEISKLDVLQLSSSLFLFTHSVYNFRLASQIANSARNDTIKSYRETLSNRQRKMFDKMSKETLRIRGGAQGRMDIIRGVNEIPDRQYLNDLFKINKNLNQQNIRPSFGAFENIVLNNEIPVKTAELRQSVQHQKGPNILKQVSKPIATTYKSDTYTTQTPKEVRLFFANRNIGHSVDVTLDENQPETALKEMAVFLKDGAVLMLKQFGKPFSQNISDLGKFQDVIRSMFENLKGDTAKYLVKLTQEFTEQHKQDIERKIKYFIGTESVLYRILKYVLEKYRNLSYEFISQRGQEIIQAVKEYFLKLNPVDSKGRTQQCPDCKGLITFTSL